MLPFVAAISGCPGDLGLHRHEGICPFSGHDNCIFGLRILVSLNPIPSLIPNLSTQNSITELSDVCSAVVPKASFL